MRTNVSFEYPAPRTNAPDVEEILLSSQATWLPELLSGLSGVEIDPQLCQEDWGVVVFLSRGGRRFWLGLSYWFGDAELEQPPSGWLVHFHHRSFWGKFAGAGKSQMQGLLQDFAALLRATPGISGISWYAERDMNQPAPAASDRPF